MIQSDLEDAAFALARELAGPTEDGIYQGIATGTTIFEDGGLGSRSLLYELERRQRPKVSPPRVRPPSVRAPEITFRHRRSERRYADEYPAIAARDLYSRGRPRTRLPTELEFSSANGGNRLLTLLLFDNSLRLTVEPMMRGERSLTGGFSCRIDVVWTPVNYGGRRARFLCFGCRERRELMYITDSRVRCKTCLRLRDRSKDDPDAALSLRTARLREQVMTKRGKRLIPNRPRGMHQGTFDRLLAELRELEQRQGS